MPQPPKLSKATLSEIWRDDQGAEVSKPNPGTPLVFTVQFNPESLKVSYATQRAGSTQPAGSTQQFIGTNSTRLSLELWFDMTRVDAAGDVRNLTRNISYFLEAQEIPNREPAPPAVRFQWGSFLFRGVLDSMDETLDLFSEDGRALRASVNITLSEQRIQRDALASGNGGAPGLSLGLGASPLLSASAGISLPQMAASAGLSADWKGIASANDIDDPLRLDVGARLDFSVKV